PNGNKLAPGPLSVAGKCHRLSGSSPFSTQDLSGSHFTSKALDEPPTSESWILNSSATFAVKSSRSIRYGTTQVPESELSFAAAAKSDFPASQLSGSSQTLTWPRSAHAGPNRLTNLRRSSRHLAESL